jgi:hypothetical protein
LKKTLFLIAIIFSIPNPAAYGCEPCAQSLNLRQTIAQSDVIIMGQKIQDGPLNAAGTPEWIEVSVKEVLKGTVTEDPIKVNSWNGMCPYGIVVDELPYMMFLVKRESSHEGYLYDAVNSGCAVKTFLVENNNVDVENQPISLENFIKLLELKESLK